jgi:hypothetical protein
MTVHSDKTPITFEHAIELMRSFSNQNATVTRLTKVEEGRFEDVGGVSEMAEMAYHIRGASQQNKTIKNISDKLAGLGIHKVVPLMINSTRANIAIVLYAGDGIVAKVTDCRFSGPTNMLPAVLPPLYSANVDGFSLQLFPWIDRKDVSSADLQDLKKRLQASNLEFREGDSKTDNIGVLPGNTRRTAVLDADAVQPMDNGNQLPPQNICSWEEELAQRFSPLYSSDVKNLVSSNPNFAENFSPLIAAKKSWASRRSSQTSENTWPPH